MNDRQSFKRELMARIIDKEEKRFDIARASIPFFAQKGIAQTSIDEIAKSAGVAKGTIYLYFKNKEEIILTIWDMLAARHQEVFHARITETMSAQEKIVELFNFSECKEDHDKEELLILYQNFLSTMLIDKTGLYTNYFATICQRDYDIIAECIQQGIAKGELEVHDVDKLTNSIMIFMEGTVIQAKMNNLNFEQTQSRLTQYIIFLLDQYTRKEPCKN